MTDIIEPEGELRALGQAFVMIIFSEIGDKTFLIAAILAMRHDRLIVFAGAFGSLLVMSILSAAMGRILPSLIPKTWTQLAAAGLFFVFGVKMIFEARGMKGGSEEIEEEMREVEEELEGDDAHESGVDGVGHAELTSLEEGSRSPTLTTFGRSKNRSPPPRISRNSTTPASERATKQTKTAVRNLFQLLFGPVFVQSFLLTFLGEWGDRSQIATIALAAAHNMYLVAFGTIVGHACCTALAVIGGRWISHKISVKKVTIAGAGLFIIFGFIYLFEALTLSDIPSPEGAAI
jgi:putative Ca2+/H+ antiporter (TMEM165/GDT1 family)